MGGDAAASADDDSEAAPLLELTWERVCAEEGDVIKRNFASRGGARGPPFSVAFSGGGVRAAAFQSGVLWRLAEEGRLRDVEYLASVSGGGYIAASFASHLLRATENPAGDVDARYMSAVAKAICRMQRNAGNFVRDPTSGRPGDGSDSLPRALDLPLLVLVLALTLASNPVQIAVVYLVPLVEAMHLFFGAALRAAFCAPTGSSVLRMLWWWSPFPSLATTLVHMIGATFLVYIAGLFPPFRLGSGDGKQPSRSCGFVLQKSCLACLTRMCLALLVLLMLLVCVPHMEIWEYNVPREPGQLMEPKAHVCEAYARKQHAAAATCANMYSGQEVPWYKASSVMGVPQPQAEGGAATAERALSATLQRSVQSSRTVLSGFLSLTVSLLLVSGVLVPFVPQVFLMVITFVGPAAAFVVTACLVKYRVYGPITGEPFLFELFPFDAERWHLFVLSCLLALFIILPLFNEMRSVFHWYYLRSLQVNFFDGGKDCSLAETTAVPQCPLLIVTGTVSDFRPPGAALDIAEISFSALHTGSEVTGYMRTPAHRTLAKCTALTGAGCLDAISLSMSSSVIFRFWLEVLNLSWGDFIFFSRSREKGATGFLSSAGRHQDRLLILLYRLPVMLVMIVCYGMLTVGWQLKSSDSCAGAKGLVAAALLAFCALVALSFFSFLPGLEFLTCSPVLRQIQQASGFTFVGHRPPRTLYVTDGGVRDCTAVVQLLRRRRERILLVLAAADPSDELGVLRTAMDVARSEKLCSFYDEEDPRRDVGALLEAYAQDPARTSFRIGIRYGWGGQALGLGRFCVVKNRLPPSADGPAPELLSEEEILGATGELAPGEPWSGMLASELGGLGCCDCCHRKGCNCARKFPHLTGANYLWLTPRLFSGLCRLGRRISAEAVAEVQS